MNRAFLAFILALTVASWAQTATQTAPSTPAPEKSKPSCCDKMGAKDGASCDRHNMKAESGKEMASCCAGKNSASCCGGKDAKSCMKDDKNAASSKECCSKDKAACCGDKCGKDGKSCCSSKDEKTAMSCCAKHQQS